MESNAFSMGALSASELSFPLWAGETGPSSATADESIFREATLNSQYSLEGIRASITHINSTIKSKPMVQEQIKGAVAKQLWCKATVLVSHISQWLAGATWHFLH